MYALMSYAELLKTERPKEALILEQKLQKALGENIEITSSVEIRFWEHNQGLFPSFYMGHMTGIGTVAMMFELNKPTN